MTRTKTVLQDDRQDGEYPHHTELVIGRDTFLSGWGQAEGKISYAGWACRLEDLETVREWVESRSDMKDVKNVESLWTPSGSNWHFHIYVVTDGHTALQKAGAK